MCNIPAAAAAYMLRDNEYRGLEAMCLQDWNGIARKIGVRIVESKQNRLSGSALPVCVQASQSAA